MSCSRAYSFIIVLDEYIYIDNVNNEGFSWSVKTNQQLTNNNNKIIKKRLIIITKIHNYCVCLFQKKSQTLLPKINRNYFHIPHKSPHLGWMFMGWWKSYLPIYIFLIYLFIFVSILPMYVGGFHIHTHMGQAFCQKIYQIFRIISKCKSHFKDKK